MEFAHVELEANDGEHEDGEEEKQPDLQEWNHGLHDGLEHHLQTWARAATAGRSERSGQGRGSGGAVGRLARAWAGQHWGSRSPQSRDRAGSMGKHESWGNSTCLQESPQRRGPNLSLRGK